MFEKVKKLLDEEEHIFLNGNLSPSKNFTYDWVKEQLEKPLPKGKDFVFMKDCAYPVDNKYDKLPEVPIKHTFLIRHPNRVVLSLRRLFIHFAEYEGDPDEYDLSADTAFLMASEKQTQDPLFEMWKHVHEKIERYPVVIDADDLQTHPRQILEKYCQAVGIPFKEKYLEWEASDESLKYFHGSLELMIWGKIEHTYDAAFLSSSFRPLESEIPATVPENCRKYAKEFIEGYKVMYETRIKPE